MPKPTRQALLTAALLARGYVIDVGSRVTRYRVFRPTQGARILLREDALEDKLRHRIYSGKAGALRFSSLGKASESIPFSERMINRLLDEAAAGGIDAYDAAMRAAKNPNPEERVS